MVTIELVLEKAKEYIKDKQEINIIKKAYEFAKKAHTGQKRLSGEDYITHPVHTAYTVALLKVDAAAIAAALLHDVLEDTKITIYDLRDNFNYEIVFLVEALTKTTSFENKKTINLKYEYIRKIILSMSKDIRVILIKIADRLHNMETLEFKSISSQKRIAKETLEVYVPIVHRLGIHYIKARLEDLCFKFLNYDKYLEIKKILHKKLDSRERTLTKIIDSIKTLLTEKNIEYVNIYGRNKHFYSIYRKMYLKGRRFDEIFDLTAISIIVKDQMECYRVLGIIHNNFPIISNRFKDYITSPKTNNYRAIHTNILLDKNFFEIQIRDQVMEQIAIWGSASHWNYKNYRSLDKKAIQELENKIPFLKYINEKVGANGSLNIEDWHKEIIAEDICVLTFDGDAVILPSGSTVLDFAYKIHTDIGNHAQFAFVNKKKSPIMKILKTGDVIEVSTSNAIFPKIEWLEYAKTNSAHQAIKKYLTSAQILSKTIATKIGKELMKNYLSKNVKDAEFFKDKENFNIMIKNLNYRNEEDFYASVYQNSINLTKLFGEYNQSNSSYNYFYSKEYHNKIKADLISPKNSSYSIAECCLPIPGDKIVGHKKTTNAITLHRFSCAKVNIFKKSKLISIQWNNNPLFNYKTKTSIKVKNRPDGLKDIILVFSSMNLNILKLYANSIVNKKIAIVDIVFTINNSSDLDNLFILLKNLNGIISIKRNES